MKAVLLAVVSVVALAACGPAKQRPGIALRGEVAQALPADWSFTREHREIAVQVRAPYFLPHSVTIWCAEVNGQLYVGAREPETKNWPGWVDRNPNVRLRIADQVYEVELTPVDDAARFAAIQLAYRAKYELPAPPADAEPVPYRYWAVGSRSM